MTKYIATGILSVIAAVLIVFGIQGALHSSAPVAGGTEVRSPNVDTVTYSGVQTTLRRNGGTLATVGTPGLTQATTTVCAIQSPAATSTLVAGFIKEDVSSTTASTITIAKAASAFATTTLINTISVSANAATLGIAASTTLSALEQTNRTFAPNQWLVFGQSGGTGTFSPTGTCVAQWISSAPNS